MCWSIMVSHWACPGWGQTSTWPSSCSGWLRSQLVLWSSSCCPLAADSLRVAFWQSEASPVCSCLQCLQVRWKVAKMLFLPQKANIKIYFITWMIFLLPSADHPNLLSGLAMVGKFGIAASFAVIYVYTAEIFPTVLRWDFCPNHQTVISVTHSWNSFFSLAVPKGKQE